MAETVVRRYLVQAGRESDAAAAVLALARDSLSEDGCLGCLAHQDRDDPRRFLLYEQYVDRQSLDRHERSAHYRRYIVETLEPASASSSVEHYIPLG